MELALDAQPADARPPVEWASGTGRKATEKIIPKSLLTLFVKVIQESCVTLGIIAQLYSLGGPLDAVRRSISRSLKGLIGHALQRNLSCQYSLRRTVTPSNTITWSM